MTSLLLIAACTGSRLPTADLTIDGHGLKAELAYTFANRQQGLMHRDTMPADHGMLFVYADEKIRGFWMKDTRLPLSIAFADSQGVIVRIADMQPFDEDRTTSLYPAKYALEMNQGWFAAHGIEKGHVIEGIPAVEAE